MTSTVYLHKKLCPNVELLLEQLGVPFVWHSYKDNVNKLQVLECKSGFLKVINRTLGEIRKSGFVPYHYFLTKPSYKGEPHDEDDKIRFTGKVKSSIEFKNAQGDFYLIHIQDEENNKNYLWKRYKPDIGEVPLDEKLFSGRLKAVIKGLNGEIYNLINYVRITDTQGE